VDDAQQRAQQLIEFWDDEVRQEVPADQPIFDAHVHLGHDIDGMVGVYEDLERIHQRYGIEKAFMFCLDEPDREPAFRAGNDRTLEFAGRSNGRLVPFVRLDLTERPIEEANRCLAKGARGIKLHPRAQRFLLNDERLAPIFELAASERVPILIHGGRGLPPIADDLGRLVEHFPEAQLIVAHAGIADLERLAQQLAGRPGVYWDTSVWSAVDLLDFFRRVPPEQVVWASDFPYGQQPASLLMGIRTARLAGFTEQQLREMLWWNANRIAQGEPPLEPSKPIGGDTFTQPMQLARIHGYLTMATPLLWTRQPDAIGALGLALNTCQERNGIREPIDQIRELLETAQTLWRSLPEEEEPDRLPLVRATARLIHLADIVAVTTHA
jgi:predicted TIM-barrel fold metal-dependent hydrolase